MVARQGGALRSSFSLSRRAILADLRQDRFTRNRRVDFSGQTKCSFSTSDAQVHLESHTARGLKMGSGVYRASVSDADALRLASHRDALQVPNARALSRSS